MTHHTDAERAEFEAAIRATMHDAGEDHIAERLERWPDGAYKDRATGYAWWGYQKAVRRAPAAPVQQGYKITEDQHVAAVKVLQRASGVDGLPQRMLDAMLAAAPQPPKSAPVELPEPEFYADDRGYEVSAEWLSSDDATSDYREVYTIPRYTEQQVRELLAAHSIKVKA